MLTRINLDTEHDLEGIKKLLGRFKNDTKEQEAIVASIVEDVRLEGDKALFQYTLRLEGHGLTPENIRVSQDEISEAYERIDQGLLEALRRSVRRVREFHEKQKQNSWFDSGKPGELLGQIQRPVSVAGLYAPGGKAAYPSSVIMTALPASAAGVERIIMATPAGENGKLPPVTIVAAKESGVHEIYKIGGAQAIAAMAFGTESVPKADKIAGPGNIYVSLAKGKVYGHAGIDAFAGPSEILIIADEGASPVFVAADMLSQAEHDEMASAMLITTCPALANQVEKELEKQLETLTRKEIASESLARSGVIALVKSLEQAVELSNQIAPEHLEICTRDPFALLPLVKNAGAVFLGHYCPEPLGDYTAGPSHVLPTEGGARFSSPLTVDDFMKKTSVLYFTKEGMKGIGGDAVMIAEAEGFRAHARSVKVRLEE